MRKILRRNKDESFEEVKAKYESVEERRANLRKVREKFHNYIKRYNATIDEGRVLTDALQEYSTGDNKGTVLGTCLHEAAEMQKFLEDTVTDLCAFSLKQLDEPFEDFIAREAENAQSVKKRYDKARSSIDSMKDTSEGDQHARAVEIADEAIEQFRQVDTALDLHTLGFTSRYLHALQLMFFHLSQRSSEALSALSSTNHFYDAIDQFEVETGRKFATFSTDFAPSWAGNSPEFKKSPANAGVPIQEIRTKGISDLLKKERVYVDTLKSLVKIYLFEFRNNRQVTKVVTLQDLEDLFCNIEEILDLHQDFTWDLQTALDNNNGNISVATLFLDFIPKLEPYVKYIANSSKSADTLSRLVKDKRYVANAIKQCAEKDKLGRSLTDLLLTPIAYIKTYRSFLQHLLDSTLTSSPDYDLIDDALSLTIQMDEKIVAANLAASQFQTLIAVCKRIEGGEELAVCNRKLIKEVGANTLESPVSLFLFNDILLVCSTAAENENHTVKRRVALANVVNAVVAGGSTVQVEVQQEPPLAFSLPSYFEAQKLVDEIKNAIQSHYKTKVFSVPLSDLMTKHDREKHNDIPSFVADALDSIEATGLEVEGIFRVSGSVLQIRSVKDAINQGLPVDYRALDTHVVAGMVQNWIRELPEPLLTYGLYNEWIAHTAKGLEVGPLRATVAKLPQFHRFLLQYLCQFLNRVASFGKVNKMRSGNLAIVFGPSLLYERNAPAATTTGDNPQQQEKDSTLVQFLSFASVHLRDVYTVVQFLIENHKEVFEGVEEERTKYREQIEKEDKEREKSEKASRVEERKAIKARRMAEEQEQAALAAAADPELVKQAQERRLKREEEREKQMKEERERQDRERKLREEEERAQLEAIRRQREEEENRIRLERQQKETAEIEQRYAKAQAELQAEEEKVREIRKQHAAQEAERRAKMEEEQKAREAARAREAKERADREAREREEEEKRRREEEERERAEAAARQAREDALPKCAVCSQRVLDGVVSKERGLAWHKECYKCSECATPISGAVAYNGNLLVCAACTQKKKGGAPAAAASGSGCGMCGKALSGRVVKVGDRRIHKDCFKCENCSGSLDDGYYEVKNKILCENCSK